MPANFKISFFDLLFDIEKIKISSSERKEKYELMYAPARVALSGMDWGALIKINRIGMSLAAAKSVLLMNFTNSGAGGEGDIVPLSMQITLLGVSIGASFKDQLPMMQL